MKRFIINTLLLIFTMSIMSAQKIEQTIESRFIDVKINKEAMDTVFYLNSNFLKDGQWVFYYDDLTKAPAVEVEITRRKVSGYYREWYSNGQQRVAIQYHSDGSPESYSYWSKDGEIVSEYVFKAGEFDCKSFMVLNGDYKKRSRYKEYYSVSTKGEALIDVDSNKLPLVLPNSKCKLSGIGLSSLLVTQAYPRRIYVVEDENVEAVWIHKDKACKSVKIQDAILGPGLLIATPLVFVPGSLLYGVFGAVGVASLSYSVFKFIECQRLYLPVKMKKEWIIVERVEPLSVNNIHDQ